MAPRPCTSYTDARRIPTLAELACRVLVPSSSEEQRAAFSDLGLQFERPLASCSLSWTDEVHRIAPAGELPPPFVPDADARAVLQPGWFGLAPPGTESAARAGEQQGGLPHRHSFLQEMLALAPDAMGKVAEAVGGGETVDVRQNDLPEQPSLSRTPAATAEGNAEAFVASVAGGAATAAAAGVARAAAPAAVADWPPRTGK